MATLKYWLWLTTRRGLSPTGVVPLMERFGTPEAVYFADPGEYEPLREKHPRLWESLMDKSLEGTDQILGECDRLGLRVLTISDADYPDCLKNIPGPPAVLYLKGRLFAFDEEIAVAVVGSREPSVYGVRMAGKLGLELARHGALVVSGIAKGLDTEALKGALKGGGPVVSVVGGGIDVPYPRENRYLYEDVAAAGALISEYPPGTANLGEHFPVRNRLISGLSLGVVAVECKYKSGTMRTIDHALDQDRDVFAVPGPADSSLSEGPNSLIRRGAALVTRGWDIVEEYADRFPGKARRPEPLPEAAVEARLEPAAQPEQPVAETKVIEKVPAKPAIDLDDPKLGFTDDQKDILTALGEKRRLADELVEAAQIPAKRVLSALTMLQVKGYVAERPGKRFEALVRVGNDNSE